VGGRRRFDRNELESYRRQNPSDFVRSKPTRMIEAGERSPKAQTVKREAGQSLTVPAGFWSRTLAMVVDLWVVAALQSALTVPLVFFPPLIAPQYLVFCFVYFSVCTGTLGQTLGKYLLSLKVVRSDGRPLTVLHGAMRTINYGLSFLPFGMGFVMAGMNRRKLAAHDWICSTRVVCVKAEFTPLILKRSVNRGVASASDGR